jgi:hypothetical protein
MTGWSIAWLGGREGEVFWTWYDLVDHLRWGVTRRNHRGRPSRSKTLDLPSTYPGMLVPTWRCPRWCGMFVLACRSANLGLCSLWFYCACIDQSKKYWMSRELLSCPDWMRVIQKHAWLLDLNYWRLVQHCTRIFVQSEKHRCTAGNKLCDVRALKCLERNFQGKVRHLWTLVTRTV